MAYGLAFVYFLFKLAERIHHFIEIRLPAEIHFSHFLVVLPQSIFEMFTMGQTERASFREFIVRRSFAKKMLFVGDDFIK